MLAVNLWLALVGVSVNILSSYHLKEIAVICEDKQTNLSASGVVLYVNGNAKQRWRSGSDSFTVQWNGRSRGYRGLLEVWVDAGELVLVNRVDEDSYLASVTGAEMVPRAGTEALKAQAVLSRTFIYKALRHQQELWDFCDLTHCQSYKGLESETPETRRAVLETEGLVMTCEGELCEVYYHSTCGGRTADARSIWPDVSTPYLVSVLCDFCKNSPHYRWQYRLSADDLERALEVSHASDIDVTERAPDGRVLEVRVTGSASILYPGWNFRMFIARFAGWATLKSSCFQVRREGTDFVFSGSGLGHGVGLCQWGAKGMAEQGKDFREILGYYFPGTGVTKWP